MSSKPLSCFQLTSDRTGGRWGQLSMRQRCYWVVLWGTFLGGKISDRIRQIVIQGVGLVTLVIGVEMALGTNSILLVLGSVLIGGILGEWWCLEERLEKLGQWLKEKTDRVPVLTRGDFRKGFVAASLVFCVGLMTVVGATQEGFSGEATLLMTKSVLECNMTVLNEE